MNNKLIIGAVVVVVVIIGVAIAFTQGSNLPAITATNSSNGSEQSNTGVGSSNSGSSGSSSGSGSSGGSGSGSGSGAPDTEVDQNSPDQITAPSSEKVIGAVKYRVCTNCGGDGEVQLITYDQQGRHVVTRTCSVCNGRGLVPV